MAIFKFFGIATIVSERFQSFVLTSSVLGSLDLQYFEWNGRKSVIDEYSSSFTYICVYICLFIGVSSPDPTKKNDGDLKFETHTSLDHTINWGE